ncbi:hypothetical protein SUGI_1497390, partial [Cryptomeria japonica]
SYPSPNHSISKCVGGRRDKAANLLMHSNTLFSGVSYADAEYKYSCLPNLSPAVSKEKCMFCQVMEFKMNLIGIVTQGPCYFVLHEKSLVVVDNCIMSSAFTANPMAHSTCVLGHENSLKATTQEIRVNMSMITEAAHAGQGIQPLTHREGARIGFLGRKLWCRSSSSTEKSIQLPEGNLVAHKYDWKGKLSLRLMVLVLNRERDWQRALALHDWMIEKGNYRPSIFAYNIVLRNILRAGKWSLGEGLVDEMCERHVSPDKFTYSTLISNFTRVGKFDSALKWLQRMEQEGIAADLITYSTLIELARKQKNYLKAVSLFSKLKAANLCPDLILYNTMIKVFGKAKLFREAKDLIQEMKDHEIPPNTESYRTLLNAYAENEKFIEAGNVFFEMKSAECAADLTTCNIMINVFGQLDMVNEAEKVFQSMKSMGILPNIVTYNTMLKVYGEAELIREAVHLFHLMQRNDIEQNIITYNTMISIHAKILDDGKATNLLLEMQKKGIEPNTITFSTIIPLYGKVGKHEKAAYIFQKLQSSGVQIDEILYQCMIVVYEKAGLVSHANRLLLELKQCNDVSRETAITILAKAGKVEEAGWLFCKEFDAGEVKDISVFEFLIDLFARNKNYSNAVDVYEKLRQVGLLPGSKTVAILLDAYGKLQLFQKGEALYDELQEEGCIFAQEVHFQMMNLHAARGNLEAAVSLFEKLLLDESIGKKDLYMTLSSLYKRSNRLDDDFRLSKQMEIKKL